MVLWYNDSSAYKSATAVWGPGAEVVDTIGPYGCVMDGDWEAYAPWRRKRSGQS